jgi:hypothetical protein
MTGLDGKVAAIFKTVVITSPNQTFVPEPLWGNREVQLRSDLRYGLDDASQWPQPHMGRYPHVGAIPRKPADGFAELASMWWTPCATDFEQSRETMIAGVGTIGGFHMRRMKKLKADLLEEVKGYLQVTHPKPILLESCFTAMVHTWVRLDGYPATFEEKCLEAAEFQRSWLELRGALTWFSKIHHNMLVRSEGEADVLDCMGVFTNNPVIAQECFSAGLPVWLLRPPEVCNVGVRIDKVVLVTPPPPSIKQDKRVGDEYPIIYKGPCNDERRYAVQHLFTRSRMVWTGAWGDFGEEVTKPLEMGGPERVGSTTRSLAEIKGQPTLTVRSGGSTMKAPTASTSVSPSVSGSGSVQGGRTSKKQTKARQTAHPCKSRCPLLRIA